MLGVTQDLGSMVPVGAGGSGAGLGQATTPLQSVLNPDGTINMKSGFSGSLDARGWQMAFQPGMPPHFTRSSPDEQLSGTERSKDLPNGNAGMVRSDKGADPDPGAGASSPDSPSGPSAPAAPGDENWDGRFGPPDVSNPVYAVAVNSSTGDVYVGGTFTTAGGAAANHVAMWSRDGWSAMGIGTDGTYVAALAVNPPTGDVYAGGDFSTAGGVSAHHIAKWNGSSWSALGSGMNDVVAAIAVNSSNGGVYAGGNFTTAGGVSANRIAEWNGSAWSPLGSGPSNGVNNLVAAIAVNNSNGDIHAGGFFTTAGGVSANRIAEWNGSTWSALGSGMSDYVDALAVSSNSDVYAGGNFTTAGGVTVHKIAKWNGSTWSALGSGMNNPVDALAMNSSTGEVYAGGFFTTAGGVSANDIAKWNGSAWSPLGSGMSDYVDALAVTSNGDVYSGGNFTTAGGVSAHYIAGWNGAGWSTLGSGMNGTVDAIGVDSANHDVYVGGVFTIAGGVSANYIAKWDGSAWSALGSGADFDVNAIAVSGNGDIYAGGFFTTAGGVSANHIAKWDGSTHTWSALGSGPSNGTNDVVDAVTVSSTGDVYAGGDFTIAGGVSAHRIAKWNGSTWSALGSGTDNSVYHIVVNSSTGDVYIGGDFTTAGAVSAHRIAKWNGSTGTWSALGSGTDSSVFTLALSSTGDVYAGGHFTTAGGVSASHIAEWNGSTGIWSALGSGPSNGTSGDVDFLSLSSTGEVYVGGGFGTAGGVSASHIAEWNGSTGTWSALGSGTNNSVYAVAFDGASDIYVGGNFTLAGGRVSNHMGLWHSPACTIQFTDVPSGSTFYPYIHCLACLGIINGYPDGTFKPNANVTRGELSKIVSNSAGFSDSQTTQMFQDVPVGSTFFQYIGRLASRGYIGGYPCGGSGEPCIPPANLPYFRPNNNATRGQISKIVSNAAGFLDPPSGQQFEDVPIASTYYTYTYRLASRNVMGGYACGGVGEPCIPPANLPYFRPNNNATRGQTSKIVSNTFFPNCLTPNSLKR
jgi:hypothetical protein